MRELENAIERVVVLGSSELILPEDLPETIVKTTATAAAATSRYHEVVRTAKRELILNAMESAGNNYAEAARAWRSLQLFAQTDSESESERSVEEVILRSPLSYD